MGQVSPDFIQSSDNDLVCKFRELALELSYLGKQSGVRIVPFSHESLPLFGRKSNFEKIQIVNDLATYLRICHLTLSGSHKLVDSLQFTWSAFRELKLRPPSDLFNFITDENTIEIHNAQGVQIFRNFKFYDCCSYSLEELYCDSWGDLYSRDESVFTKIMETVIKLFSGQASGVVPIDSGEHIITEVRSPLRYQINAKVIYLAPLTDEAGIPKATIAIETGHVMNKLLSGEEEESLLRAHMQNRELDSSL